MITSKLNKAEYNSKVKKFKMEEDLLQFRVYLLKFINSIKIVLSTFNQTCMLLMEYPSIEGEGIPEYSKQATCNLLNAYIDAIIQRLIYEYPEYGVESITTFQLQCANMNFADKSRYNKQCQQVVHKGWE